MRTPRFRRLAHLGTALALSLSPTLASAQDGSPPTGPPVTNPNTNKNTPVRGQEPRTTSDVLPAIPATARDPAPPGTRGVRVDTPAVAGATRTAQRPASNAGRVFTAEGVVTRLDRAGKNVNGELERFAFDPSQDWNSYVNRGVKGVPEKDDERPKTNQDIKAANEKQHEDAPDKPKVMEMVITRRTYVYTHARDLDGVDHYAAATASSPDSTSSRTGLTRRTPTAEVANQPKQTNFTNIREGSFVAVRYRKVGDLNEVLNLTLIELPMNPTEVAPPGATPTTSPAGTPGAPGGVRVPTIPRAPAGVDIPR